MNTCINCGKPTNTPGRFAVCTACVQTSDQMTAALTKGLVLELRDPKTGKAYSKKVTLP